MTKTMRSGVWLAAVLGLAGWAAGGETPANRVKNPELTVADGGKLASWNAVGSVANIRLSNDTETKPENAKQSLKLEILQADPQANDGDIRQEIKTMPDTDYVLKAWMKTSIAGVGYLQIKGMGADKKTKNLATFDTSGKKLDGQEVELAFNSGDSTRVFVLLRYRHRNDKYEGETAWFADVRVEDAPAK